MHTPSWKEEKGQNKGKARGLKTPPFLHFLGGP